MGWYDFNKIRVSSLYGTFRLQARGSGRLHWLGQRYGFDQLIIQAIRLRLRYPFGCPDIERWIDRLVLERDYSSNYYFTDRFDPAAVTIRRVSR